MVLKNRDPSDSTSSQHFSWLCSLLIAFSFCHVSYRQQSLQHSLVPQTADIPYLLNHSCCPSQTTSKAFVRGKKRAHCCGKTHWSNLLKQTGYWSCLVQSPEWFADTANSLCVLGMLWWVRMGNCFSVPLRFVGAYICLSVRQGSC